MYQVDPALLAANQINALQNLPASTKEAGCLAVDQEIIPLVANAVVTVKVTAVAFLKAAGRVPIAVLRIAQHVAKAIIVVGKK